MLLVFSNPPFPCFLPNDRPLLMTSSAALMLQSSLCWELRSSGGRRPATRNLNVKLLTAAAPRILLDHVRGSTYVVRDVQLPLLWFGRQNVVHTDLKSHPLSFFSVTFGKTVKLHCIAVYSLMKSFYVNITSKQYSNYARIWGRGQFGDTGGDKERALSSPFWSAAPFLAQFLIIILIMPIVTIILSPFITITSIDHHQSLV